MNEQEQILFTSFLAELKQDVFQTTELNATPDAFVPFVKERIKGEYQAIYFYLTQYAKDFCMCITAAYRIDRTGLPLEPEDVLTEILTEPTYIDGTLCPIKNIIKSEVIKSFAEKENVPYLLLKELHDWAQEEDEEINGMIKELVDRRLTDLGTRFNLTHFPEVSAEKEARH